MSLVPVNAGVVAWRWWLGAVLVSMAVLGLGLAFVINLAAPTLVAEFMNIWNGSRLFVIFLLTGTIVLTIALPTGALWAFFKHNQ